MTSSIPDLERLYECGDILANAKGLSYKSVRLDVIVFLNFNIKFGSTKPSTSRSWPE